MAREEVTIEVKLNGVVIAVETVSPGEAGECVGGTVPTDGWPAGHYRFEYWIGDEMLAAGEFDLVEP